MKDSPTKTVCFFNSNVAWGGGEKWHFTTAKELHSRGYNVYLVTNTASQLRRKGTEERLQTYAFSINNLSFLNPIKILVLAAFFKSKKIETIILNLPIDLKVAGVAAKLAGVKKIIYRRGMPHPLRNTWLNRFLFTKILTGVIANSKEVERSLVQGNEAWFPKEKVTIIYNGIDTSKPIDRTTKMYQKQGDEIVIGNAGRLTEQKGQKYLVELGKLLAADGVNFKILIAGEGELRESLTNQIKAAGLEDRIKLIGHVEDMSPFYNSLDVFVFTSLWEGMANTLVEVLWHGIPTIAWDVSSNAEVIEDGVSGWLVKLGDLEEMKNQLKRINGEKIIQAKEDSINIVTAIFSKEKLDLELFKLLD